MASRLFSRSSTSQSLWETDFEKRVRSSRGPTPELRLRVSSIHYVSQIIKTRARTPASRPPRLTLASCRIVSTTDRERGNTGDELTVLFRFEVRPNEKQKDINQGSEVWVWRPYQYVEISHDIARSLKMIANGGVLFCSRFHIPPSSES